MLSVVTGLTVAIEFGVARHEVGAAPIDAWLPDPIFHFLAFFVLPLPFPFPLPPTGTCCLLFTPVEG